MTPPSSSSLRFLWGAQKTADKKIDLINWAGGKFLYGRYHFPDHWLNRWEKDAEMMQAAGINLIKTGEGAWATFEPSEGHFDFSWMDRAIKVFSAHGIRFILGTPSYSPPAWLFEDILMSARWTRMVFVTSLV